MCETNSIAYWPYKILKYLLRNNLNKYLIILIQKFCFHFFVSRARVFIDVVVVVVHKC